MFSVPVEPANVPTLILRFGLTVPFTLTVPPSAIVSVPVPTLPMVVPPVVQVEPAPVTVTVPCEPASLPTIV